MIYKRFITLLISFALTLGLMACGTEYESTQSSDGVSSVPAEEATTGSDTEPESDDTSITVATGTITGQLSTPYATEEGDQLIASLIMPTIYSYDRSGDLLKHAASGKTIEYNDTEYTYKSIANISAAYDAESDISTYTITLATGAKFSDGTDITADDLIFTYYFLCDDSYNGDYSLSDQQIIGIKAYQLNNTMAPSIEISSEDINDTLDNPSDEIKSLISQQIIRPVLEEGRTFCEENWKRYVDRGYGESAQELFVMLFPQAIESEYDGTDKTFDEIFEETLSLYGMNYKAIARIYYGELDYLDDDVKTLVRKYLYEQKLATAGGSEVAAIDGITRLSNDSVCVRVLGKGSDVQEKICNIPILSLAYYGDADSYDYENSCFGLTRGDVASVKSHSGSPLGYGPYTFESISNGVVTLNPNPYYIMGEVPETQLKFMNVVSADRIANLQAGNIDLALLELSSEEVELIKEANDGTLSGSVISSVLYNAETYEYFGLNAATLNMGTDNGLQVRQALATLITSYKEAALDTNLGDAGKLIYYPGSSSSGLVPSEGDADYIEYFVLGGGTDTLTYVRELLTAAGYKFADDGTVKTSSKLRTEFTFAIPSYIISDHVMMEIYENLESALDELGFTVTPTYFDQLDEYILALESGKYDIWLAERSTVGLTPDKYYSSEGESNYYGLSDTEIDELLAQVNSESSTGKEVYPKVYNLVMAQAVEVPIYQKQVALIYNTEKITVDDRNFTEFYTIFSDLSALHLGAD